jgi:hypothetical protein
MDYSSATVTVALLSAVAFVALFLLSTRNALPLPPGPRGLPLLRNLLDIPKQFPWEVYAQWGRKLGM